MYAAEAKMNIYLGRENNVNTVKISPDLAAQVCFGPDEVTSGIVKAIKHKPRNKVRVALDGWYGVPWQEIINALTEACEKEGISVRCVNACGHFRDQDEIAAHKKQFITDDPSFGWENRDGVMEEIVDPSKAAAFKAKLDACDFNEDALVVYSTGAAIPALCDSYDLIVYYDKMIQSVTPMMWEGNLIPIGFDKPDRNYFWKEYFYCDFHYLIKQKLFVLGRMDFYVDAVSFKNIKLIPRATYDAVAEKLSRQPMKQIETYQGGPWGAYRFKQLENIEGLECNAWHSLVKGDSTMEVDIGAKDTFLLPFPNMHQYARRIIGKYVTEKFPLLFPLVMSLDDGWFPEPVPPHERTSMPMHSHPGSDYNRRVFNEYWGRYETYYIVEAYKGGGTWLGYKDDADIEEWERKCRESENTRVIENWKDYVSFWDSKVGDLFLIPPGTVHGHGGNQMVLEMDTYPTVGGNEYSFFIYDFARNSWNDNEKKMNGKPMKMHTKHAFNNERWRREGYVKDHLLATRKVIEAKDEYCIERYSSISEMPFEIECMHYYDRGVYSTQMKFMHLITLTRGKRAKIRSLSYPELEAEIVRYHSAIVPAEFGEYEVLSMDGGFNTVTIFRMKNG